MAESKTTAQAAAAEKKEEAAEKRQEKADEREAKTAARERQEAETKRQAETAEKSAARAKAVDSGKVTVVLRDDADAAVHDVKQLIGEMGGTVKSASGRKLTVELPEGSERQTDGLRQKLVEHLLGSPLVEDIE